MKNVEDHLLVPISKPKVGVAGKTGSWRVFKPVINYEKCIKCYLCYLHCPDAAIDVKKHTEFPKIDYDYCKGCGICADVCPVKAITMERE
ncbi:MAG: 4Fe-4S binding protein [Candidatus Njordarchaeota archaeon]